MPEQERKKMLAEQAMVMFALLWRSSFLVVVVSLSAIAILIYAEIGAHLPASPWEYLPASADFFAETFTTLFFATILIAWLLVFHAIGILNKSAVSEESNDQASHLLKLAGWLMFAGIFVSALIVSLSALFIVGTIGELFLTLFVIVASLLSIAVLIIGVLYQAVAAWRFLRNRPRN